MYFSRPRLRRIAVLLAIGSIVSSAGGDISERRPLIPQVTTGAFLKQLGISIDWLAASRAQERSWQGIPSAARINNSTGPTSVALKVVTEIQPIPFETAKTFTRSLRPGQVKQIKAGEAGQRLLHYRLRMENGSVVSRTQLSSIVIKRPANRVVAIGYRGHYTSRGEYRSRRIFRMSASAYDPGPTSCGRYATGRTACGLRAGYGVAAVDPKVIPLGARLYVEGYGFAIAGDRGRAIKGNRIDLGFNTYREAKRFGRKNVIVHVLEE